MRVGFHAAHLLPRRCLQLVIELFHRRKEFFPFIFSDIRMIVSGSGETVVTDRPAFHCYVFLWFAMMVVNPISWA